MSVIKIKKELLTPPLAAGQVWQYHTRVGEELSTLTINHIDIHPDNAHKVICHLSIEGVSIHSPQHSNPVTWIRFVAVTEKSLRSSLTRFVKSNAPDESGIEDYTAYRESDAGVFSVPVAEVVAIIERALNPLH